MENENDERNVLSPISNLPYSDILILSECRLYDGVDLEAAHRLSRVYRFFLGISKFIRTYSSSGNTEFFLSKGSSGGVYFGQERFLRIVSDKIVNFGIVTTTIVLLIFLRLWKIPMIRIWSTLSFVTILSVMIDLFLMKKNLIMNCLLFVVWPLLH